MRTYLSETVQPGVEQYVEEQVKIAITKAVQAKVTELNGKITDLNATLADAKTKFDDANTAIGEANTAIEQLNRKIEEKRNDLKEFSYDDDDINAMMPGTINSLVKPDGLAWSVESIVMPNDPWDWATTKSMITTLSDRIDALDGLLKSIDGDAADSLKSQAEVIKEQKDAAEGKINYLQSNWSELFDDLPTIGTEVTMEVPELTAEKKDIADAKAALAQISGENNVDDVVDAAKEAAGDAFDSVVNSSSGPLTPEALNKFVARAIQEELNGNATYLAIEDLLPLTGKTGSLELKNVTIDTIGKFKTAAGVSLDTLIQNNLPGRDVVGGLHRAAAALEKLPAGATIHVTVEGKALFTGGTINADTLATALNGSSVDAIYDNLCGLLTSDAKALSMGAFAKPVGENNYQAVIVTVTGGAYDYPLTVYLQLTNI